MVGGVGIEPTVRNSTDLQSAVHPLNIPPIRLRCFWDLNPMTTALQTVASTLQHKHLKVERRGFEPLNQGIACTSCVVPDERPLRGEVVPD